MVATGAGCSGAPDSGTSEAAATERATWVREQLRSHNASLSSSLRAEKYDKMSESAFSFYRGTNHLFWADLADDERVTDFGSDETVTWIQGDAHANNFGAFHDDEGRIVYDLNDFDEAVVADFQLDVWRLATSVVLVARENGLDEDTAATAVEAMTESYLASVNDFVDNDDELDAVVTESEAYGRLDEFLAEVESDGSRTKLIDKWTKTSSGKLKLDTGLDDLAGVSSSIKTKIKNALVAYGATLSGGLSWSTQYFAVKDVAQRLHAGVGSLGVARYYVLVEGPTTALTDDILLDVKQVRPPTALEFLDDAVYPFSRHGERAAKSQKALGVEVDNHLGWLTMGSESYVVRERSPWDETFPTDELTSEERLVKLAEQWGAILAAAHARADDDFDADLVPHSFEDGVAGAIGGREGEFTTAVVDVALAYATQVDADYQTFLDML
jgi:uncharacterized protein (DUF2252 family)